MIDIHLRVGRTGKARGEDGFNWSRYFKLSENKGIEFQVARFEAYELFYIGLDTHLTGRDHAGPTFHLQILGFYFAVEFQDKRHWDYETGTWEKYGTGSEQDEDDADLHRSVHSGDEREHRV